MMDLFHALILGIVQGLTEFLPISSSAHLILFPWFFGWQDPGLTFDVALHLGTLVAVLAFFRSDWTRLMRGLGRSIVGRTVVDDLDARMFWLLIIASVPGAVVGALAENAVESWLRTPAIIAGLTIALGIALVIAELVGGRHRALKDVGLADSLVVGISQALAICPGVSRSGITITAGLFRGMTREAAARFSFLMSTPIIAGAGLYNLRHLVGGVPSDERLAFFVGFITAALVGYLCIKVLLHYLQRNNLLIFAYYRFALGALIFGALLVGFRT